MTKSLTEYTFQTPHSDPFKVPFATDDEAFEYAMGCDDNGATSVSKQVKGIETWWHIETQSWLSREDFLVWAKANGCLPEI